VTLCLPADFLVDDAISLYGGLHEAAKAFDITLAGGDIVRAPVFTVTVALSGWADAPLDTPLLLRRNAAEIGDVVAVSGNLGDSAGGLLLMRQDLYTNTDAERHLRIAHQRPQPRVQLGRAAVAAGVRCGIDISDGLIQDLGHVARASKVGIRVDAARLPVSEALQTVFPAQALGLALTGGEDYELALIGPRLLIESLLHGPTPLTEIGEVVHYDTPRVAAVDETGTEIPLGPGGWDHFAAS
jgi:thiamine-monophosphate kinase